MAKANGNPGTITGYTVGLLAFEDSRDLSKGKAQRGKPVKAASANGKDATAKRKSKGQSKSHSGSKRKAKTGK